MLEADTQDLTVFMSSSLIGQETHQSFQKSIFSIFSAIHWYIGRIFSCGDITIIKPLLQPMKTCRVKSLVKLSLVITLCWVSYHYFLKSLKIENL